MKTNNKINVLIPRKIALQIQYTCKIIPLQEWKGFLFCSIDDNNILVHKFIPKKIGNIGYVETGINEHIDVNKRFNSFIEENNYDNCFIALIHSHNNMNVFFSGTDYEDFIEDVNTGYALSIVTNNKNEFYGMFGYKTVINNNLWKNKSVIIEEEVNVVILDDEFKDSEFISDINEMIKKKKEEENENELKLFNNKKIIKNEKGSRFIF